MGVNFSRTEQAVSGHCTTADRRSTGRNESETSDSETMEQQEDAREETIKERDDDFFETQDGQDAPRAVSQEMVEFEKDLAIKREQRKKILAKHAMQKENLRKSLEMQIKVNQTVINENNLLRDLLQQHNISIPQREYENEAVNALQGSVALMTENYENIKASNNKLRRDLAEANLSLQSANSDLANLQGQNIESMKQINALKDVVAVTKTMMKIRETQLNELKEKLSEIETSLADREASLLSTNLRSEYERQLQNIRSLRTLYEERARLADVTRLQLLRELDEQKVLAAAEANKCKDLTERLEQLEAKIVTMTDDIDTKDDQISVTKEESRGLKAEMSTVNQLFSQMLLGHKSKQDLDKLISRLEEHHGLLTHMVVQDHGSEASVALPKLLLDLVGQIDSSEEKGSVQKHAKNLEENSLNTTAEEIVGNLPKVWRVLMELLSHQSGSAEGVSSETVGDTTTCYKSVETPSGPQMVPSVSQTYIRLKDLIVEKLSLTKEMNKMKQLNVHLETRLEEQERRLCLVTSELSKTWHVVGRLRRSHHQLHTHEKILRYELQQKRKMLNELKEELEYCREKWDKAKEKNCESEKEWRSLRTEFSNRKSKVTASVNNSGESGYSDERQSEDDSTESNDDSEFANEPLNRCKKRIRKIVEIPDSSTDVNLVGEREDPISDMLDVADLPLDGLDAEENTEGSSKSLKENEDDSSTSESCASENFPTNLTSLGSINPKKICPSEECRVEDGRVDIAEQCSTSEVYVPANLPQEILDNIRKQTERLAKRDERLMLLEESSASLLKQVTHTAELRTQINERLQKLRRRNQEPGTSVECNNVILIPSSDNIVEQSEDLVFMETPMTSIGSSTEIFNPSTNVPDISVQIRTETETDFDINAVTHTQIDTTSSCNDEHPLEDFEKSRKQNQPILEGDERRNIPEEGCSAILSSVEKNININHHLDNRFETIPSEITPLKYSDQIQNNEMETKEDNNLEPMALNINDHRMPINTDTTVVDAVEIGLNEEPSTSRNVMDHEARFAARDERLKRLEEQTKSLVNKVNDTATKSVKITYKLEELHNIYGPDGGHTRNNSPSVDESEEPTDENSTTDT